jgi:hypothetical protein
MTGMLRKRLTFANVVSVLALFVALGGSAWAISSNSIGSPQIKPGGVKNSDIADNAVTSRKVADHSLLGKDFDAGQLPQGPPGERGPQGPQGLQGAPGTARAYGFVSEEGQLSRSKNASVTNPTQGVTCISVPGISSTDTPIIVSLGDHGDITDGSFTVNLTNSTALGYGAEMSFVYWNQFNDGGCPAGTWEVETLGGGPYAAEDIFYFEMSRKNEPFSFVVP